MSWNPNMPGNCRVRGCQNQERYEGRCLQHYYEELGDSSENSTPTSNSTNANLNAYVNTPSVDLDTRRERNRVAAKKSRQRKLDRIQQLQEEKDTLEKSVEDLTEETKYLQRALEEAVIHQEGKLSEEQARYLSNGRIKIIEKIGQAYSDGRIRDILGHFHDDFVLSGPDSSLQLKGKDAILADYACTSHIYEDFKLEFTRITSDGVYSKHFRANWVFTGIIKRAGTSSCPEFIRLFNDLKGQRVSFTGASNYSFSGQKVIYLHRCVEQSSYLSSLVNLNSMQCKKEQKSLDSQTKTAVF